MPQTRRTTATTLHNAQMQTCWSSGLWTASTWKSLLHLILVEHSWKVCSSVYHKLKKQCNRKRLKNSVSNIFNPEIPEQICSAGQCYAPSTTCTTRNWKYFVAVRVVRALHIFAFLPGTAQALLELLHFGTWEPTIVLLFDSGNWRGSRCPSFWKEAGPTHWNWRDAAQECNKSWKAMIMAIQEQQHRCTGNIIK